MEKLAINLYDLDRLPADMRGKLLGGRLDLSSPIRTDWDRKDSPDELALLFTCPLLTAAIVCDIIRDWDVKAGDFPTRIYLKRKEWTRIPSHKRLTVVAGSKSHLNPDFFKIEPVTAIAPPIKRII